MVAVVVEETPLLEMQVVQVVVEDKEDSKLGGAAPDSNQGFAGGDANTPGNAGGAGGGGAGGAGGSSHQNNQVVLTGSLDSRSTNFILMSEHLDLVVVSNGSLEVVVEDASGSSTDPTKVVDLVVPMQVVVMEQVIPPGGSHATANTGGGGGAK